MLLLILVIGGGAYITWGPKEQPHPLGSSSKVAAVTQKSKDLAAAGVSVGKGVKSGATTFMEKVHTIMSIDQTIALKRQDPSWTPLSQIPLTTQNALLAIEDHDFYNHGALDISSIFRAMLVNATAGEIVEGGSTLTQQLVKNLFLSDEQSLSRKAEEATIAFLLEHRYTKKEILELYWNTTYLGAGSYGIREASAAYFKKEPAKLTLGESCVLASLPYAPSALNPFENAAGCAKRMQLVLSNMEKYHYVTEAEAAQARFSGVSLKNGVFLSFHGQEKK